MPQELTDSHLIKGSPNYLSVPHNFRDHLRTAGKHLFDDYEIGQVNIGPNFILSSSKTDRELPIVRSLIDRRKNASGYQETLIQLLMFDEQNNIIGCLDKIFMEEPLGNRSIQKGDYNSNDFVAAAVSGQGIAGALSEISLLLNQAFADQTGRPVLLEMVDKNIENVTAAEEYLARATERDLTEVVSDARALLEQIAKQRIAWEKMVDRLGLDKKNHRLFQPGTNFKDLLSKKDINLTLKKNGTTPPVDSASGDLIVNSQATQQLIELMLK